MQSSKELKISFTGRVLYDFKAQAANQLSLTAGETIKIVVKGESGGWSKGEDDKG
jgi:hypothetical protein